MRNWADILFVMRVRLDRWNNQLSSIGTEFIQHTDRIDKQTTEKLSVKLVRRVSLSTKKDIHRDPFIYPFYWNVHICSGRWLGRSPLFSIQLDWVSRTRDKRGAQGMRSWTDIVFVLCVGLDRWNNPMSSVRIEFTQHTERIDKQTIEK